MPVLNFTNNITPTSSCGPYSIGTDGLVIGANNFYCCNKNVINTINLPNDKQYYWYGGKCYQKEICNNDIYCVNDNFDFDEWNEVLYPSYHNGNTFQDDNSIADNFVSQAIITGFTFYVDAENGNMLNEFCCKIAGGTYLSNGVCSCNNNIVETYSSRCLSTLDDILALISTPNGKTFFIENFPQIGYSLNLNNDQINFIIRFIDEDDILNDVNSNNIPDSVEAKLMLTTALNNTGGFYVDFGDITNTPRLTTENVCIENGYWDTQKQNCMCKPVNKNCEITITNTKIKTISDEYNNPVQIVVNYSNEAPIGEDCCNKLIEDYNTKYKWSGQYCYATEVELCVPATINLNEGKNMVVEPCDNDLKLSLWFYFGTPNLKCEPKSDKKCCYNSSLPIIAEIKTTETNLNQSLTQVKTFNSETDGFDTWVRLESTLPTSGLTLNFGLNVEITQGLSCCCNYDIFVDDIRVDCLTQESLVTINNIKCPGFEINKVIDNKKSWVYNPGLPEVGISIYDDNERLDGSFGLLNGEGSINRTFAPSLDANIPWRYTNYFEQSGVYENHSNLVINSKELWLTYDMCANCPISATTLTCPEGYILSANTTICYSGNT